MVVTMIVTLNTFYGFKAGAIYTIGFIASAVIDYQNKTKK